MSDFGLCATDVREPRQVRKEATVTSLSVCRRIPEVWPNLEARNSEKMEDRGEFRISIFGFRI